jgi:hypothetical protein
LSQKNYTLKGCMPIDAEISDYSITNEGVYCHQPKVTFRGYIMEF